MVVLHLACLCSLSFSNVSGPALLSKLQASVACSAGSACHEAGSGGPVASSVLQALNVPPEFTACTLRLSVGRDTTAGDVDLAVSNIVGLIQDQECTISTQ